jgi:hypothetical protein
MQSYEFNITIVGVGREVDEAFSNALRRLSEDAESAIKGEVIYVSVSEEEPLTNDDSINN